jgi:hypothetical protein
MLEIVKRLAPRGETLRELFLKSGNLCAFPGCGALMMDIDGTFIGQLCHIEAADEGGERFNPSMSNEERRSAANLMLMCYPHHQTTNDVAKFPTELLRKFKADHEGRFSRADRAILETLTDWTTLDRATKVQNLAKINRLLNWNLCPSDLTESVTELNGYIEHLEKIPIEVRRFVGAVAQRAQRVGETRAVESGMSGFKILASDLRGALKISASALREKTAELDAYNLGDSDQIETDVGAQPAIRIRSLQSGWPVWLDLAEYCALAPTSMSAFVDKLDFARLDD